MSVENLTKKVPINLNSTSRKMSLNSINSISTKKSGAKKWKIWEKRKSIHKICNSIIFVKASGLKYIKIYAMKKKKKQEKKEEMLPLYCALKFIKIIL